MRRPSSSSPRPPRLPGREKIRQAALTLEKVLQAYRLELRKGANIIANAGLSPAGALAEGLLRAGVKFPVVNKEDRSCTTGT